VLPHVLYELIESLGWNVVAAKFSEPVVVGEGNGMGWG